MKVAIFAIEHWFDKKFDGRKKIFRGISRDAFNKAVKKHRERRWRSMSLIPEYERRRKIIKFFASIPYEYQGDGLDDYNMYQRPANNGVGYVAICPGERTNNLYTDDPLAVTYLTKKYKKYKDAQR